jgi:hypothetical protein
VNRQFVSYPKSGRTWLRYMLAHAGCDRQVGFHHDGFEFNDGARPPHDFDLAGRLARFTADQKVVYLERDPRDVMVSLYHQVTGRFQDFFDYRGSLAEFIRDGYFGAGNLARFRAMWAGIVQARGFLRVSYEECHADPLALLQRIVAYYGFEVGEERLRAAVEAGAFERMRELELSMAYPGKWLRPRNGATKVRKGKVHGFRDELSAPDIAWLDGVFGIAGGPAG